MPVPPNDANTPKAPLHLVAECATRQVNDERKKGDPQQPVPRKTDAKLVVLHTQKDSALMWKAAAVHPMQPLQNVHQRLTRDAVRVAPNDDAKQEAESNTLSRYYYFDSAGPKPLGFPKSAVQPPKFPDERLEDAVKEMGGAKRLLKEVPLNLPPIKAKLDGLLTEIRDLIGVFGTVPAPSSVPTLRDALQSLANADHELQTQPLADTNVKRAIKELEAAAKNVGTAQTGFCCIQNLHTISPFYLFRLLVRFRIESADPLTPKDRAGASGQLTGFVNDNPNDTRGWLFDWLARCIRELDIELKKIPGDHILFFLKGGRALKYLEGDQRNGENDWDTQIVINPDLPVNEWYDVFRQAHNVALRQLKQYKYEFFMLMYANAAQFETTITQSLGTLNPLNPDLRPRVNRLNCKSELIDIGIPRIDTVECHEQWHLMHGNIMTIDHLPLPNWMYYINEYILMVREAFNGTSLSPKKTAKRLRRLWGIVDLDAIDQVVATERALIPTAKMAKSLAVIDQQDKHGKAVLTVLMRQFGQAYELKRDPGLAKAFDDFVDSCKADLGAKAEYSQDMQDGIKADTPPFEPKHKKLADVVGFGQFTSKEFEKHLRARGTWLWSQRKELGKVVKAVYTASIFKPEDELQLQFAVTGSYAAALYADYFKFPQDRMTEIEAVDYVEVRIYAGIDGADAKTIREIVGPMFENYIAQPTTPNYDLVPGPENSIDIYWHEEVDFGNGFKYTPRAFRVSVEPDKRRWPSLNFIWGYPVVGLRDLIREYDRKAAYREEFGTQQRLKKTTAALVEILTKFENNVSETAAAASVIAPIVGGQPPLPPPQPLLPLNPTLAAIAAGTCHHLMISSLQGANNQRGEYPAGYAADKKFLIELPDPVDPGFRIPALPASGVDRSIDLLVINQGHGDMDSFAGYSGQQLDTMIVQPLIAAGVTVKLLVVDACLSATLIPRFKPLLAADGRMIMTMYSTTGVLIETEMWNTLAPALQQRDVNAIFAAIQPELVKLTRYNTGYVNIGEVRDDTVPQDTYVGDAINRHAGSRDLISIARYLRWITAAVRTTGAPIQPITVATPAIQQTLNGIAIEPHIGPDDAAVLATVPQAPTVFDDVMLGQVHAALRQRFLNVLTQPAYGYNRRLADINGLPTFAPVPAGGDNLWEKISGEFSLPLGRATGLDKAPSLFAVYTKANDTVTHDAAFVNPLTPRVAGFLDAIWAGSSQEVAQVNNYLNGLTVAQQADYLH